MFVWVQYKFTKEKQAQLYVSHVRGEKSWYISAGYSLPSMWCIIRFSTLPNVQLNCFSEYSCSERKHIYLICFFLLLSPQSHCVLLSAKRKHFNHNESFTLSHFSLSFKCILLMLLLTSSLCLSWRLYGGCLSRSQEQHPCGQKDWLVISSVWSFEHRDSSLMPESIMFWSPGWCAVIILAGNSCSCKCKLQSQQAVHSKDFTLAEETTRRTKTKWWHNWWDNTSKKSYASCFNLSLL